MLRETRDPASVRSFGGQWTSKESPRRRPFPRRKSRWTSTPVAGFLGITPLLRWHPLANTSRDAIDDALVARDRNADVRLRLYLDILALDLYLEPLDLL